MFRTKISLLFSKLLSKRVFLPLSESNINLVQRICIHNNQDISTYISRNIQLRIKTAKLTKKPIKTHYDHLKSLRNGNRCHKSNIFRVNSKFSSMHISKNCNKNTTATRHYWLYICHLLLNFETSKKVLEKALLIHSNATSSGCKVSPASILNMAASSVPCN